MNKSNWLIATLIVGVVILVGAVMFLLGRGTALSESEGSTPTEAMSSDSEAEGKRGKAGVSPSQTTAQNSVASDRPLKNDRILERGAAIPPLFRGEWNGDLADCGTGDNDTRLRVGANRIQFYESDGEVRGVTRHDSRTITVALTLSGEGQTWNDSRRMVLSRSGNDLTIDGFSRHRCP